MDVMNFKVVSLVIVVEVILSFYWLSINQQEAFGLRVALPLRVTPSGEPGKNFSRKNVQKSGTFSKSTSESDA